MPSVAPRIYDIVRVIAEGGQAQVCLLRERSTSALYAGKFLREAWDPIARQRFVAEARRQIRVAGPGVVPICDYNFNAERPFIVLEYMPRGSLAEELHRRSVFPLLEALRTTREIAARLSELHSQGVVHGDLKPANIMRHADGRLLLNDLGLGATMGIGTCVTANGFFGTPPYAAPEQYANYAVFASDVYALGVTLHEFMTGSRDLGTRPLSPDFVSLIAHLTHHDHRQRPSAYDAYQALDAAVQAAEQMHAAQLTAQQQAARQAAAKGLLLLGAFVGVGLVALALDGAR